MTLKKRINIFSYGGGTQTIGMAAMIINGDLPKPGLAVIIDTERETDAVWRYMNDYVVPGLAAVGVELHRVKKSAHTQHDLYFNAKNGQALKPLMPMFLHHGHGRLKGFCSDKWKTDVFRRWANAHGLKGKHARVWIGFSLDEKHRCKVQQPHEKWLEWYPLIEKRLYRLDSIRYVEAMGWPTPPRSACWMCPNHSDSEWLWLKLSGELEKAVVVEE